VTEEIDEMILKWYLKQSSYPRKMAFSMIRQLLFLFMARI